MEASVNAGFDLPRRAVETALGLAGEPFGGAPARGTYMRLDFELAALVAAMRRRRDGGAPLPIVRRAAAIGLSPRGRLDPFPLDPFWIGPLAGRAVRRAVRAVARA